MSRVYRVEWSDPSGVSGWEKEEDAIEMEPVYVVTVGEIVARHPDRIIIAATRASNGTLHDVTVIPRGVIHKVRRLA